MTTEINRRDFLKLGAAVTATAAIGIGMSERGLIPLPMAAPVAPAAERAPENPPHKWVMVIDQSKCVGCDLCLAACHAYNDTPPNISWSRVEEVAPTDDGRRVFRPVPCQHCQDAPCVMVCPAKATYHRYDGLVMMDYDRCIGCRYCQLACPYGVRHFNWETFSGPNPDVPAAGTPEIERRPRGVVEKCSFCVHRIDRGLAHRPRRHAGLRRRCRRRRRPAWRRGRCRASYRGPARGRCDGRRRSTSRQRRAAGARSQACRRPERQDSGR